LPPVISAGFVFVNAFCATDRYRTDFLENLKQTFPTRASSRALFAVAQRPLEAPLYLNFVAAITPEPSLAQRDSTAYDVVVNYRHILRATGLVRHKTDEALRAVYLTHDGPLAKFDAVFLIHEGHVELSCTYRAKTRLLNWLVRTVLARALRQVAAAMDAYAASFDSGPT
jgi:hypothetical protein